MNNLLSHFILIILSISVTVQAQKSSDKSFSTSDVNSIQGTILDKAQKTPLAYANIGIKKTGEGTISNENGNFSLSLKNLNESDTIYFQYLGFKTISLSIGQLKQSPQVLLEEDIISLDDFFVFGSNPNPKKIIRRVITNLEKNYPPSSCKMKAFVRERTSSKFSKMKIDFVESTFSELGKDAVNNMTQKIPKNTLSYTDFYGEFYLPLNPYEDIKIKPLKTVSLKDKSDMKQIESVFKKLVRETKEDEYWKIKTGFISLGADLEKEKNDSLRKLHENKIKIEYFAPKFKNVLSPQRFDNKDVWEFLYKTSKYKYTLVGGTKINNEDVYIIDFEPKDKGLYQGRVYVTSNTYALLKANYEYAGDKMGSNMSLLGLGYEDNAYQSSIYFEKRGDHYSLKYFFRINGNKISVNRELTLIKKRKRFLFDKTLNEFCFNLDFIQDNTSQIEILILDEKPISKSQYKEFSEKEWIDVIYVDQFDDKLWEGYSIIEPTKQMKDYRKLGK